MVDDNDFDFIDSNYELYVAKDGYVMCRKRFRDKNIPPGDKLHRLLMKPKSGKHIHVDHRNGNKLDCQRSNLRICSNKDNMKNRKVTTIYANKNTTSKYKGVTWSKTKNYWEVRISDGESYLYLGAYTNEDAAANCYNYYSDIYYKEFGRPNQVPFMHKSEWESFKVNKNKSSKYKGVSNLNGKWVVQIWDNKNKKNIRLDGFSTEEDAAIAYNEKAIEIKGEKAKLNEIKSI